MSNVNPYATPSAPLDANAGAINTSGMGAGHPLPDGIAGWSWGAFFWNWLWSIFNRTWIGLLCLVPYVGFIMSIYLGVKGREMAWRNKRWDSVEHFNRVQRTWSLWALGFFVVALLGVLAAVLLPAMQG